MANMTRCGHCVVWLLGLCVRRHYLLLPSNVLQLFWWLIKLMSCGRVANAINRETVISCCTTLGSLLESFSPRIATCMTIGLILLK